MTGEQSNQYESHKLNTPFTAYDGDGQYIFVSYKHADSNIVFPVIKELHDRGFDIWYDDGLTYGENYDIEIAQKIKNSSMFMNFVTQTSMACANDPEDY